MAEKKSMSTLATKGVAFVTEQPNFAGRWGTGEHLALMRCMTRDALSQACKDAGIEMPVTKLPQTTVDGKPKLDKDGKPMVHTLATLVNKYLSDAHRADPELGYASNMDKLLKKMGVIKSETDYE